MARKKKKGNVSAKPDQGWLVTFGDLLTLLITFFVLLISMSSMDKKKLKDAFGFFSGALGNLESGQGGKQQEALPIPGQITPMRKTGRAKSRTRTSEAAVVNIQRLRRSSNRLVERLRDMRRDSSKGIQPMDENLLELLAGAQSVQIRQDDESTEIGLHLGLMFQAGRIKINPESFQLLKEAAAVGHGMRLRRVMVPLMEHGLTSRTHSPWELAAWRSSALVRALKQPQKVPASVADAGIKKRYVQLFFETVQAEAGERTTNDNRGAP